MASMMKTVRKKRSDDFAERRGRRLDPRDEVDEKLSSFLCGDN